MKQPFLVNGRTAIVTGAASGIGRAIAFSLARRGCHLALADINSDGLDQTAVEIGSFASQLRVTRHHLDVANRAAVVGFPVRVLREHPGADILVNNAGVAVNGTFEEISPEDFDWLFSINFHSVVNMTRAVLPLLKASDDARIVNLSSIFGLLAVPTAYSASKFAVRGFSEALSHELEGTKVGVTVVYPAGVATAIVENARQPSKVSEADKARQRADAKQLLKLSPDIVGERIVQGIERRALRLLVGRGAAILDPIVRLAPVSSWRVFGFLNKNNLL
jgi:NAD(P)-dependent dehydrogenase (short-subunit alcohol dehydrogenase family)